MNGAIAKYEAKTGKAIDPATHQWLSAAVGAIVNQAAGMSMQTGAAEAVYGTKWNYWGEETITQNIKKVKDTIEETKYETGVLAMENAKKLIENGTVSFEGMPGDYYVGVISAGQGLKAASTAFILDRHGNVYANVSFAPGFMTGVPFSCGSGWLGAWNGKKPKSSDDYKKLISGWSGSISIVAGIGGTVGAGDKSVTGEFQAGANVNISGAFGYTFYVGNIKDAVTN